MGLRWQEFLERRLRWKMACERTVFFKPDQAEESSIFSSEALFEAAVRSLLPAALAKLPLRFDPPRHVHRPGSHAPASGQNFLFDPASEQIRSLDARELFRQIPMSYRICRIYAEDALHNAELAAAMDRLLGETVVDDATNKTGAQFFEEETTRASFETFDGWVEEHGVPCSVYVDRDSIYRCERAASVAEQVAGQEPQTQFGRAMSLLGVELILANSPQAKGRVERRNGLLQDRLVKALRLRGISDLDGANNYLKEEFLRELNEQFTVAPASPADVHRPAPGNLGEVLSWEETRVVQRDWTVAWENAWYQIDRRHEGMSLAGKSVVVRRLLDGSEQLIYRGQKLVWRKLPARPERQSVPRVIPAIKGDPTPAPGHAWRGMQGMRGVVGKEFWKAVKKQGRLARALRPKKEQEQRQSRKGHSLLS